MPAFDGSDASRRAASMTGIHTRTPFARMTEAARPMLISHRRSGHHPRACQSTLFMVGSKLAARVRTGRREGFGRLRTLADRALHSAQSQIVYSTTNSKLVAAEMLSQPVGPFRDNSSRHFRSRHPLHRPGTGRGGDRRLPSAG